MSNALALALQLVTAPAAAVSVDAAALGRCRTSTEVCVPQFENLKLKKI
jgi:hypothetical protein